MLAAFFYKIFVSRFVRDDTNNAFVVMERAQWRMAMGNRETAQSWGSRNWCRRKRRKLTGLPFQKPIVCFYGIESIDTREYGKWCPPTVESGGGGGLTSSSLAPFCARWPRHDANNKFRPYKERST